MNKASTLFLTGGIMLVCLSCLASAYRRTVLVEDFTNWGCPPCAPAVTLLHETLLAVGTPQNATDIAYHMNWPSSTDPFYLANPTDNYARRVYYGVNAVPTFEVDGTPCSPWSNIAAAINNRLPVPSPLWMDLFAAVNGSTINLTAKVVANVNISGNYVIQMVLMDRYDYLPASPNGNPNHYHAMRKMAPTASGQPFSATAGDTVTYTASFTVDPTWSINNLDVNCFVQNNDTREVLQTRMEQVPGNFPGLDLTMTPVNPPIEIPAAGGTFAFNVNITNSSASTYGFDGWIMQQLPNGTWQGPMLGPVPLTLAGGASIVRQRNQNVPASAPPGTYTYRGYLGYYWADFRWDSSGFTYAKLSTGNGKPVGDWNNSGESFEPWETALQNGTPGEFKLTGVYPNPFNPTTTLSFTLPEVSLVTLKVFDVNGRQVANLVNGWRNMGTHEVTFDASNLPSGVYLYRLSAGHHSATGKMMLIK